MGKLLEQQVWRTNCFAKSSSVKFTTGIESLLILAVAAIHFSVVSWRVGAEQFVADAQIGGSFFKQRWQIASAVKEVVCKLEAIICLDALEFDITLRVPLHQSLEKICRGISRLFRISR